MNSADKAARRSASGCLKKTIDNTDDVIHRTYSEESAKQRPENFLDALSNSGSVSKQAGYCDDFGSYAALSVTRSCVIVRRFRTLASPAEGLRWIVSLSDSSRRVTFHSSSIVFSVSAYVFHPGVFFRSNLSIRASFQTECDG